jgi:hypothetical protein
MFKNNPLKKQAFLKALEQLLNNEMLTTEANVNGADNMNTWLYQADIELICNHFNTEPAALLSFFEDCGLVFKYNEDVAYIYPRKYVLHQQWATSENQLKHDMAECIIEASPTSATHSSSASRRKRGADTPEQMMPNVTEGQSSAYFCSAGASTTHIVSNAAVDIMSSHEWDQMLFSDDSEISMDTDSAEATDVATVSARQDEQVQPAARVHAQKSTFPLVLEQLLANSAVTAVQMTLKDGTPSWVYKVPITLITPLLTTNNFRSFHSTLQAFGWEHLQTSCTSTYIYIYPFVYKLTLQGADSQEQLINDTVKWIELGKNSTHNKIKEKLGLPQRTWVNKPKNLRVKAKKASKPRRRPFSSRAATARATAIRNEVDSNTPVYRMSTDEWLNELLEINPSAPAAASAPEEYAALDSASSPCAATEVSTAEESYSAATATHFSSRKNFSIKLEELLNDPGVTPEKLHFKNGHCNWAHRIPKDLFATYIGEYKGGARRILSIHGWTLNSTILGDYFYIYPKKHNFTPTITSSLEQLRQDTAKNLELGKTQTCRELKQLSLQRSTASPNKPAEDQADASLTNTSPSQPAAVARRTTSDEFSVTWEFFRTLNEEAIPLMQELSHSGPGQD